MKCKILTMFVATFLLTSCASTPMEGQTYVQFANLAAGAEKCFESGLLNPKVYSDAKSAYSYALESQNYDKSQLDSMQNAAYYQFVATPQSCRETEAAAYSLLSEVEQRKTTTQNNINNYTPTPLPRTVNCTTYAGVTTCI